MAWLALSPDTLVPTITLAEKTKVPAHYLAKVLQQLAGADLVTGRRGVRGGYKLARPASDITLLNVVNAVGEVKRVGECPIGMSYAGGSLCPLHRVVDQATRMVIELLEDRTLEDLLADGGKPLCEADGSARLTVSAAASSAKR